jgi:hypothetical protein
MTQTATRRRSIRRPNHFSGAPVASDSAFQVPPTPRRHGPKALTSKGDFRYFMDRSGRQHFNFVQRIWLDPAISMEFTTVQTTALETLAVNLLTLVTRERDCRTAVGITSQRALALTPQFCVECLLGAPVEAWELPRASIKAWIESHRPLNRARRGNPSPCGKSRATGCPSRGRTR